MSQWKRVHRRVPFAFRVAARWEGTTLVTHCQRIATMGLYAYHHDPFPADAEIELEFELPVVKGAPIITSGRVRRSDQLDDENGLLGGMQILFTDLADEHREQIEAFVSSCLEREAEYSEMKGGRAEDETTGRYDVRFFGASSSSRTEYVEDISEGGILIRTLRPRPKGQDLEIDLYLPGGQKTLIGGTVVWSLPHRAEEPGKAGMGVQFTRINSYAQRMIANFVSTFGENVQIPIR